MFFGLSIAGVLGFTIVLTGLAWLLGVTLLPHRVRVGNNGIMFLETVYGKGSGDIREISSYNSKRWVCYPNEKEVTFLWIADSDDKKAEFVERGKTVYGWVKRWFFGTLSDLESEARELEMNLGNKRVTATNVLRKRWECYETKPLSIVLGDSKGEERCFWFRLRLNLEISDESALEFVKQAKQLSLCNLPVASGVFEKFGEEWTLSALEMITRNADEFNSKQTIKSELCAFNKAMREYEKTTGTSKHSRYGLAVSQKGARVLLEEQTARKVATD